jgi:hypothetical protein
MKLIKTTRNFWLLVLLATIVCIGNSCKKDDDGKKTNGTGTINGVITDKDTGSPIAGVTVTVSGIKDTITSGIDGKYSIGNVSKEAHYVKFSKSGFLTIAITATAKDFDATNAAVINAVLQNATAKITGTVTDAKNGKGPLAGVTVSIGTAGTVTTGNDGKYSIENLLVDSYTITFTKAGYATITRPITSDNFIAGVVTLDVSMGATELLRGLTAADLVTADKWYYNEYRGGGNGDSYPHWDWSCDYMCSNTYVGDWEEQWEGTTLRIRNAAADQTNPANTDVFDSYTYGSKKITADNKILSLRIRTHNPDVNAPVYFGVQVVDLSEADPKMVKIGENRTCSSDQYADYDFDLSAYVGKEVIIAIGTYRYATGDYWKQLVLRSIRFAGQKVTGWDWLPGTEVITGWKLTQEMVRSTMVNTKKSFTGISPKSAGRDVSMTSGYPAAYRSWRDVNHIAYGWSFVPLKKDPEVTPSEGYLIKTRDTPETSTVVPEAYYYSKFAIAAGSNQLTLKTRNFSSAHYTYFKLTAIKEDGTVTHIAPSSNTATEAAAADDGCWKFKHEKGGSGDPDAYASFVYDLSQFNGNNVVLVFGVYNGEASTGENKLVFYSVNLN